MAEGKFNEHGIYEYGEDDQASLVSTLLNKLALSVTTVVASLKGRVTALELAAAVPVTNGRYTAALTNQPTATAWTLPTPAIVAAYSSTGATTLWSPIANGLRFRKRGIYLVSVKITSSALLGGRCFLELAGPGDGAMNASRFNWTPTSDETQTALFELIVPSDDFNVSFTMYHSSGAARSHAFRIDATRIGAL